MTDIAKEALHLIEMLPDEDKLTALDFIKKLVLKWDPDFTRVTPEERERISHAEKSGFVDADKINWNTVGTDKQF